MSLNKKKSIFDHFLRVYYIIIINGLDFKIFFFYLNFDTLIIYFFKKSNILIKNILKK